MVHYLTQKLFVDTHGYLRGSFSSLFVETERGLIFWLMLATMARFSLAENRTTLDWLIDVAENGFVITPLAFNSPGPPVQKGSGASHVKRGGPGG